MGGSPDICFSVARRRAGLFDRRQERKALVDALALWRAAGGDARGIAHLRWSGCPVKRIVLLALASLVLGLGAPASAQSPSPTTAIIETSMGAITLSLDSAKAPTSVDNFIRYAREGHFDGTAIYRVVPNFVIQMGSYTASGRPRATHGPIPLETAGGLKNVRGAVAMTRDGDIPASATAEFFIDLKDNPALDPDPAAPANTTGYAVFAHVTAGMDVVDKIAGVELGGDGPFPGKAPRAAITITRVVVK
jgi:cyclophilin family peptidyl-prolyl cis-trans isomerase